MGLHYLGGLGVDKDEQQAVRFFRLAADMGDAAAMLNLGLCFARGKGVEKNEQEAVRWLSAAAQAGNEEAARILRSFRNSPPLP